MDVALTNKEAEASNEANTAQETNQEPMDATDSGQGQDRPSEQLSNLSPGAPGRQRKKNPKYFDYDTGEKSPVPSPRQRRPRRTPVKKGSEEGEASGTTPAKRGRAKKAAEPTADGDREATDQTARESVGETSQKTTKKTKRTPAKKTPAKKKETPKPKRQYARKQAVEEVAPASQEDRAPVEPEDETVPGGRPRRGAAKAALKYLHSLAKEVFDHSGDELGSQPGASSDRPSSDPGPGQKGPKGGKAGGRGQKRKRPDFDSDDTAEDEDFVPDVEEEEGEEMEEEEAQGSDCESDFEPAWKTPAALRLNKNIQGQMKQWGKAPNGLSNNIMKPAWESTETNKKFREEHCSSWVFPEWVPSVNKWHHVPHNDLEKYLPQELQSAAFKVSRDGLSKDETPLQRLNRFEAVASHPERWDMSLYAGGPVWAMEWCPTPDGAPATQYVALACHRGMDDQHFANEKYAGSGLVQLWDLGKLEYDNRPESQPALAYGLAQDKGFIWHLKWCPAGAWELPSCSRKAPFLPRLGLLAAATSTGVVTIYSLPHPDALHTSKTLPKSEEAGQPLHIYQAEGVITLKLGSFRAPHEEKSGQVLSMDWLPDKPHNIMAIGFYDGVVGLWDLSTKSSLLRVRDADRSLALLPYRCFLAHDNAVRALAFCPASSRNLLATAGDDRMVKTWDLKRIYEPITVQKRHLTTEVYWPLNASGLFLSQENAFATHGLQGVHYYDLGYHNMRSIFVVPRIGTMWSMSFTDWLNGLVTSDTLGEVIFAVMPRINGNPQFFKRTIERRFPVYFTDMVPFDAEPGEEENRETAGSEEGGGEAERTDAGAEGEKESDDGRGGESGRGREDEGLPQPSQTYREAVKKYYLHYSDNDMGTFKNFQMRPPWKRMQATEVKTKINMDMMPMAALHKVRFNPNMSCHTWVASGGQAGLVRVHCLRSMNSSQVQKMVSENQAQFNALYSPEEQGEAVQTSTQPL
ncbi:general transcription factor 3C polypeptide 2 isoform X1 [Centroberyx affinis]|uniref:general transcription factor 3C polypeptide 2 isoform X1 n=1 Tax=Centroberyx affinis TaxID=166261 RepID=UPI003A5BC80B